MWLTVNDQAAYSCGYVYNDAFNQTQNKARKIYAWNSRYNGYTSSNCSCTRVSFEVNNSLQSPKIKELLWKKQKSS